MPHTLEHQLGQDIEEGVPTFTPPENTETSNLISENIQNLINSSAQDGLQFTPTLPTTGTQPTLEFGAEADLAPLSGFNPIERPQLDTREISPVSLGTELTPGEERAQLDLRRQVRTGLSARGLGTSAAGADIEAEALREFRENILEKRFQQERILTAEALQLETQRFGEEATAAKLDISVDELNTRLQQGQEELNIRRGEFAVTKGVAEFNAAIQSESQRFGQEGALFSAEVQEAATTSALKADLFNQQVASMNLGFQERGIEFNEQLSVYSANLGAILGSREQTLNFIKFVSDRDFENARLILAKQQVDQETQNNLINAVGNIIGFGVGAAIAKGKLF